MWPKHILNSPYVGCNFQYHYIKVIRNYHYYLNQKLTPNYSMSLLFLRGCGGGGWGRGGWVNVAFWGIKGTCTCQVNDPSLSYFLALQSVNWWYAPLPHNSELSILKRVQPKKVSEENLVSKIFYCLIFNDQLLLSNA